MNIFPQIWTFELKYNIFQNRTFFYKFELLNKNRTFFQNRTFFLQNWTFEIKIELYSESNFFLRIRTFEQKSNIFQNRIFEHKSNLPRQFRLKMWKKWKSNDRSSDCRNTKSPLHYLFCKTARFNGATTFSRTTLFTLDTIVKALRLHYAECVRLNVVAPNLRQRS